MRKGCEAMIRTYKIHYRVFWKLADDPLPFERETEERAWSAEDALTQVRIRLDSLHIQSGSYTGRSHAYEITKIEPMEEKNNDR
jgi:hypothetical protein